MRVEIPLLLVILLLSNFVSASNVFTVEEGELWVDCNNCSIEISKNDAILANGSNYALDVDQGQIELESYGGEDYILVLPDEENWPNQRPSPMQQSDHLNIPTQILCPCELGLSLEGRITSDQPDIIHIDTVNESTHYKIDLMASSDDLLISVFAQNLTNEWLIESFEISTPVRYQSTSTSLFVQHDAVTSEEHRIFLQLETQSPRSFYSMNLSKFDTHSIHQLTQPNGFVEGFGPQVISIPFNHTQEARIIGSDAIISQQLFVQENSMSNPILHQAGPSIIWAMPSTIQLELSVVTNQSWIIEYQIIDHGDGLEKIEAPAMLPQTNQTDNQSWPLLPLEKTQVSGELSLPIMDYVDVYRIETSGWDESIHLFQVVIEGDVRNLEATIWDMNQDLWIPLDSTNASFSMKSITISSQLGLGTHFLRIQLPNGSDSLPQEWGGNASVYAYTLDIHYELVDEGEEPWFPPNQEAVTWGERVRWILGIGMLLPAILLAWNLRIQRNQAAEILENKERIKWVKQRIQEVGAKQASKDLEKSLSGLALLEWEDAILSWGEPMLRHMTEGIDIAAWALDEQLTDDDSWPLLVGIKVGTDNWEIAGMRFEAPEGEPWEIKSVKPRLLSRDDEIFLDQLSAESRTFVQVNIIGSAAMVSVHISGMVNEVPMAAKPSNAINRFQEEE
ncbi:MAG TPA: hypothetical protein D7H86_02505 [Candidatus Poseidoniales archaeon]|nr:MAG TPA: hypothetical protein D7H86_02505 [Candidatus Poseidoniales archaeon]